MRTTFLKRMIDIAVAGPMLVAAFPLMIVIGLLISLRMGRPILFRQMRPGLGGRPFVLLKFRTMSDTRSADGQLLADAQRLTRLGRFLRRTSLDELPQLLNVLAGQMSLVGPRPLLMRYLPRYSNEQARRHDVKPGLTGWAQINGRNALSWDEKFSLDVWYVDHQSLRLDLRILARTFWKVLRPEGISHQGEATMPEFWGVRQPTDAATPHTSARVHTAHTTREHQDSIPC